MYNLIQHPDILRFAHTIISVFCVDPRTNSDYFLKQPIYTFIYQRLLRFKSDHSRGVLVAIKASHLCKNGILLDVLCYKSTNEIPVVHRYDALLTTNAP